MMLNPQASLKDELGSRLRQIGWHAPIYAIASMANALANLIVLPVLANHLSTEMFGIYSLLQMIVALTQATFYLGISSALSRSFYDHPEGEEKSSVVVTSTLLSLLGSASLVVLGALLGRSVSQALFHTPAYAWEVFLATVAAALVILNQLFLTYLRLQQRSSKFVLIGALTLLGQVGATYALVTWQGRGVAGAMWATIFSQLLVLPFLLGGAAKHLKGKFRKEHARVQIAYGIPQVLLGFALVLIDWGDRLVLEHHLSLSDVGVYSMSYRMSAVINALMITPFTYIWNPLAMEHRSAPFIKQLFQRVFTFYVAFGCVALIGGTFALEVAVTWLIHKPEYHAAFPIVPLIMGGTLAYGLTNITSAGFQYSRRLLPMVAIFYAVAMVRLGLNWVLVPFGGYWAAAGIALLTHVVLSLAVYHFARKWFDVSYPWKRTGALFLLSIGAAVLLCRVGISGDIFSAILKGAVVGTGCAGILAMALVFLPRRQEASHT